VEKEQKNTASSDNFGDWSQSLSWLMTQPSTPRGIMVMVSVARKWICGPSQLAAWSKGWWLPPPLIMLHPSDEPGELSQWLCRYNSTVNNCLLMLLLL